MTNGEFNNVVEELGDSLFRFAVSRTGDTEMARDAVQDSFINLWKENKEFGHYLNIKAYCLTLVKNRCIDLQRVSKRHPVRQIPDGMREGTHNSTEESIDRQERLKVMSHLLSRLSEKDSTLLMLRDFEEYPYAEIGKLMGMSLENVKVSLHRARRNLRSVLAERNGKQHVKD